METRRKNDVRTTLSHLHSLRIKLMLEGIVVGVFAGLLIVFYRIALERAEEFRLHVLRAQTGNIKAVILWFILLAIGGYFVGRLVKKDPMISGSGIPQVEGVLVRKLEMNWLSVIVRKIVGGVISISAGLSLGREGPSIQLGAAMGQGISRIFKRIKVEEKYLITGGASAGLAAAFNAPLAGVMFALEEVHKHFSPLILLSAMSASLTADFISKYFFGLKPVFNFENISALPLNSYGYIIILGIIVGVFGVFYNYTLLKTQDMYKKAKWLPMELRTMVPFIMAGFLGLVLPQVLGGGHPIIESLIEGNTTMKMLLIILIGKFVFSMISFGSGAPGGIFFPLLVLGALTGAIYANILVSFFNFNPHYINNFIILAMAGYFTAIVRAPITGSILITEMTGSFTHLLSLSLISIVAYIVADLLGSEPVYESLLDRMLKSRGENETLPDSKDKVILEIPVFLDSEMDGKAIKELNLPADCLLVSIKRGEKEIIPRGNTKLQSGDYLLVLANESMASKTHDEILKMSGKPKI